MPNLPDIAFFHTLADAAAEQTLPRYRSAQNLHIGTKPKEGFRFDPVTDADREAERAIRALISAHYPEHAILGEEFGAVGGGDIQWILDPVDGTRPFLCGIPVWGTLMGLLHNGRAVMGMMSQPFTKERFWADGIQSWYRGPYGEQALQTRKNLPLTQAILHTTSPEPIPSHPTVHFQALTQHTLMTRYGGECYAMAMLAAGHIDICVEYGLQPYDIAALIPIIEQAGGIVTTLDGGRPEGGGNIVASGDPQLHQQALAILNG
ncbi:histidinol-phosphatase [Candidatus Symbiopectobacterium sp. NZEC135]|uniref:histidinol-phosphatase n=1 Tax=Candidatus Symbiopectobacterium sp. NZEC135 TaxID=2820471 RepID=UPI0022269FBF|nr:histidinol-phosphatase [Candidatus Symbiopectobacterium sp. NZEC135]MCW2480660.1 histidinol-phosphatase [Candidatus Symbiopectobacterium sp. NZEC135]